MLYWSGRGGFHNRGGERKEGGDRPHNDNPWKHAPENAPKDSWYYKYHFGPWPKQDNVEVTLETKVPELRAKEHKVPEPSKEKYAKDMEALDKDIENLRD